MITLANASGSSSLHQSSHLQSETKQDLSQYDAVTWKCIRAREGMLEGKILSYAPKDLYDMARSPDGPKAANIRHLKKIDEIFPAVEPRQDSRRWIRCCDEDQLFDLFCVKYTNKQIEKLLLYRDDLLYGKQFYPFFLCEKESIWRNFLKNEFGENNEGLESIYDLEPELNEEELRGKFERVRQELLARYQSRKKFDEKLSKQRKLTAIFRRLEFRNFKDENGSTIIEIPNRKALQSNWNQLRKENSDLPEIHFIKGQNIEKNLPFIRINLLEGIVISNGIEKLHDIHFHAGNKIELVFSEKCAEKQIYTYEEERKRVQHLIEPLLNILNWIEPQLQEEEKNPENLTLKEFDMVATSLGLAIDSWSASRSYNKARKGCNQTHVVDDCFKPFWVGRRERLFWQRKFKEDYDQEKLNMICSKI